MWFIIKKDPEGKKMMGLRAPHHILIQAIEFCSLYLAHVPQGGCVGLAFCTRLAITNALYIFGQFNKCIVIVTTGDIEFI